ncbi:MAG: divalent-cation tolerance protein CutA [Candidatus Bilamarchaeaceae archaeon]
MKVAMIYVTNPNKRKAEELALHLLRKKAIGCANLFPVSSFYRWKGRLVREKEFVLIAKTTERKVETAKKEIESVHPYSVPFIAIIRADVNNKYLKWLENETK